MGEPRWLLPQLHQLPENRPRLEVTGIVDLATGEGIDIVHG